MDFRQCNPTYPFLMSNWHIRSFPSDLLYKKFYQKVLRKKKKWPDIETTHNRYQDSPKNVSVTTDDTFDHRNEMDYTPQTRKWGVSWCPLRSCQQRGFSTTVRNRTRWVVCVSHFHGCGWYYSMNMDTTNCLTEGDSPLPWSPLLTPGCFELR